MGSHIHESYEYAPFGGAYVRRECDEDGDAPGEWEPCAVADVPQAVMIAEALEDYNRKHPRLRAGAIRLANPVLDAIAVELGLTPDELRERTNDTSSVGTLERVSDVRWAEIAEALAMTPTELEDRFAGRHEALVDPSRPGAV